MHVNGYLHKCLHHKIHPGKQHCKGAHTKRNIQVSASPHAHTPTPALASSGCSDTQGPGARPHWLRRLETTAGSQAEKIRRGPCWPRAGTWWCTGHPASHPCRMGYRGAERTEVYFKWPRQIRELEFAFSQTTAPSLPRGEKFSAYNI